MKARYRYSYGFVAGVTAFIVGVLATAPLVYYLAPLGYLSSPWGYLVSPAAGFESPWDGAVVTLLAYTGTHLVYLPPDGLLPAANVFPMNSLDEFPATVWFEATTLFYSLPVVVLTVSGYLVARSRSGGSKRSRALAGASVSTGYLAMALASTFAVAVATDALQHVKPVEVAAFLVLPATVHAAFFGGVGGLLTNATAESTKASPD